ncbi:Gfo/Idh/MocA family oxidoreductase [Halobacteria archaeon AArc-curdl1]|uniref:Gfo/Idh/MocA family oxidoreductase n=1 Tax=Natronosalvus hydrolyticus TaxID=2979988 RepID=A0AAP2ZC03_9EURY|nr:Gfo/Idh/MocA family oxidoreductase [Halobacteria archaeon AArc-curdl1]
MTRHRSEAVVNDGEEPSKLRAGVIGVGAMGANHARIYSECRDIDLVGVVDLDHELAMDVAKQYGTTAVQLADLVESCDLVSVAVPTFAHADTVRTCLEAEIHVLVEKPLTESLEEGRALCRQANEANALLQVGHVERFNPAVDTAAAIIEDLEVIAIDAQRLGPPVDRPDLDGVVLDLMIHDIDVIGSLLGSNPTKIAAQGTGDGQYATATMHYDDVIASVTASRRTQKKVRTLTITTSECLIEVDYLEQSVLIHRDSYPEYVTDDGTNRYRHESVIERPRVHNGEPLKREIRSFIDAIRTGSEPAVTATDGLEALETVTEIERLIDDGGQEVIVR